MIRHRASEGPKTIDWKVFVAETVNVFFITRSYDIFWIHLYLSLHMSHLSYWHAGTSKTSAHLAAVYGTSRLSLVRCRHSHWNLGNHVGSLCSRVRSTFAANLTVTPRKIVTIVSWIFYCSIRKPKITAVFYSIAGFFFLWVSNFCVNLWSITQRIDEKF